MAYMTIPNMVREVERELKNHQSGTAYSKGYRDALTWVHSLMVSRRWKQVEQREKRG